MKTSKGMRLHIGFFGRRNVGKSSLINALTRQKVSIVSEIGGTTTDPVVKSMEIAPIGPVTLIDTAGLDDDSDLGRLRIDKTKKMFNRTDVFIIVARGDNWGKLEEELVEKYRELKAGIIVVFNKCDIAKPASALIERLNERDIIAVETVATEGKGILELRGALIKTVPDEFINSPKIIGDLAPPGKNVVLVTPIDKEAPKGRLILPQVQTIRDILDNNSFCTVVKETELVKAMNMLKEPPSLVVTDSQAFEAVNRDTPPNVMLTSFSILFARFKGDLEEYVAGVKAIDNLPSGARILIAEACTHHPIQDDIGRDKIPRWLKEYLGKELEFIYYQGRDFPYELGEYDLVIHCGGCMLTRRETLNRIMQCKKSDIPITNYGMVIAFILGILERALQPFQNALNIYRDCSRV